MKSIMAMPFFHPPGLAGPPSKIVFPLMLLDSGTSMVVDIFGIKNERSFKDIYYKDIFKMVWNVDIEMD
jgi:hypothetical protein